MNPIIDFFNGNFPLTISFYCILLVAVVVITTLLSRLSVILKEKAHLSTGVVAGLLLGVITSLPELVTCLTSVFVDKSGSLGFGDIIGSNIFDIFVLAICLLVCVWVFIKHKANQTNIMTLVFTGVGTVFVFLAMLLEYFLPDLIKSLHGFNILTLFVLASYVASIFFMTRNPRTDGMANSGKVEIQQAHESRLFLLDLKWIITLLIVVAVVLIACSVFLTYTSQSLIFTHWASVFGEEGKASFGGALLLGVVTSLPEIVCCINLCVGKEYNMVIDTIVGSTSFNLSILTLANIAFACVGDTNHLMFDFNEFNITQVATAVVMSIFMIIYLVLNSEKIKEKFSPKQMLGLNITMLSISALSYVAFLVLGFIW